ncbi:hypothetical protein [Gordonia sp. (in: high G+C Gram-positive bacteria)]|uniref:hypothetical protein n=1 Tax=Gordonia sp. (in: high G+C Gram-positive bacteria) TaxID=84139 RepID=UPI0025794432|nr:hypothetical protein [Gordonia sp. (in: high G+C Gram-positive bacteria)]
MTTDDRYPESLAAALATARFPSANHEFIRHLTAAIGISGYRHVPADERYIAALRQDGRGELRIYSGYTIRFVDEAEARRVGAGADTIRPSVKAGGGWLVSHPEHGDLDRRSGTGGSTQDNSRQCPNRCGYELSARGRCPTCDDD